MPDEEFHKNIDWRGPDTAARIRSFQQIVHNSLSPRVRAVRRFVSCCGGLAHQTMFVAGMLSSDNVE